MGREEMIVAALQLQCDGNRIQTNIHDMTQFLGGLYEAASEVQRESLRTDTVQFMKAGVQSRCTMHFMVAMCLWRSMNIPT